MRKALAISAVLLALLGTATAGTNKWNEQTYSTYESYEELNTLYNDVKSTNGTVINESGGFITATEGRANIAFNSSAHQGIKEIDGIKVNVGIPSPLKSSASIAVRQTEEGTMPGTTSASLTTSALDGPNTIYQEDMIVEDGYDEANTFTAISTVLDAENVGTQSGKPRINSVTFIKRTRPVALETTDLTVNESWTSEAFTAEKLSNFTADLDLGDNETMTATIKSFNDTAETGNQTFELVNGSNEFDINNSNFGTNSTTYNLELDAGNKTVNVSTLEITGITSDSSLSGAIGGGNSGIFSGNFFESIPNPFTSLSEIASGAFEGLTNFLDQVIPV